MPHVVTFDVYLLYRILGYFILLFHLSYVVLNVPQFFLKVTLFKYTRKIRKHYDAAHYREKISRLTENIIQLIVKQIFPVGRQ